MGKPKFERLAVISIKKIPPFFLAASVVVASSLMLGCANKPSDAAKPSAESELMEEMAVYANRASIANQRLASVRSGTAGIKIDKVEAPAGLDLPVSIAWSGPLDQLVKKVAELSGYQFGGVLGTSRTPILVSVNVKNTPAFDVLADAGAQAGSAAEIVVHPNTKKIVLKYPATVRTGGYPVQGR